MKEITYQEAMELSVKTLYPCIECKEPSTHFPNDLGGVLVCTNGHVIPLQSIIFPSL